MVSRQQPIDITALDIFKEDHYLDECVQLGSPWPRKMLINRSEFMFRVLKHLANKYYADLYKKEIILKDEEKWFFFNALSLNSGPIT